MIMDRVAVLESGLEVFGRLSASFTHDLKNILAIINENAGLLEDLCFMLEKEGFPNLEKFRKTVGKVQVQIKRADLLIKTMNTFSHGNDDELATVSLEDHVRVLLLLTKRLQDRSGVTVEVESTEEPLELVTKPFFLHCLIWLWLESIMSSCSEENRVRISLNKDKNRIAILLTGMNSQKFSDEMRHLQNDADALKNLVQAEYAWCPDRGEFHVFLPGKMGVHTR